jgi:hypothetical protein
VIVSLTAGFLAALLSGQAWMAFGMALLWAVSILDFALLRLRQTKRTPEHVLEMIVTSIVIPYLSVFWRLAGAFSYRVWFF